MVYVPLASPEAKLQFGPMALPELLPQEASVPPPISCGAPESVTPVGSVSVNAIAAVVGPFVTTTPIWYF